MEKTQMLERDRNGRQMGGSDRVARTFRGRQEPCHAGRPRLASAARRCVVAIAAAAFSAASAAATTGAEFPGQDALAIREALGGGMHAYHSGDYSRAYDDLTTAIEAGTEDPRGLYFRGLAALRLGRSSEAEADFTAGADRELASGSTRRVSQSLERVQGPDRLTLERFRARARLAAIQRDRDAYGRRYSGIEDAASEVRRRRRPEDIPAELVAPGPLTPAPGVEEVPAPSAEPQTMPAKPGKPLKNEPEAETEAEDPFGDEPPKRKAAEGE